MGSSLAVLICIVGIAGLFYLDREESLRTSKALWLAVIWLWIVGSRPVSAWLGFGQVDPYGSQLLEGSPVDRLAFMVLVAAGIIVLLRRRSRTGELLRASRPILIYFAFCLLSVLWSDYTDVAFKRWIKAVGDLVMVLVVVTEAAPVAALERLISRVGFILLPTSVLFIRYFGDLGRGYDPDGLPMNTGVTTNKNSLGVITLVLSLGVLWRFLTVLRAKDAPNRTRHLLAQGTSLAFGVALLSMAHSATSVACFMLGTVLIVATGLPSIRRRPGAVHALVLTILLGGGFALLIDGGALIVRALGRQTNLTGRTDIWAAVLPVVPNPIVGAGFESFWLPPRLEQVWSSLSKYMHVNEAHNGYIEVYLNLGWVGLGLIVIILISGYRHAIAAFRCNPSIGSLMLAYVAATAFYSITEAGFRMLLPLWIFFLLAVVGGPCLADHAGGTMPEQFVVPLGRIAGLSAGDGRIPTDGNS